MTPAQLRENDEMLAEGLPVQVGVLPELDPIAGHYAELWSTLRSSTPHDQPISLISIALFVGVEDMHRKLPLIQIMDRAYFERQRERVEAERTRAEKSRAARRGRRG